MKDKKETYTYQVVSTIPYSKSGRKQMVKSTVTIDPEFEERINELMSCEIIYSELEYI